jgi:hypothetical protein
MTATSALTGDLQEQVHKLEKDLLARLEENPDQRADWQQTHRSAVQKERTAASWVDWREDRINQTAVAWVLMSVFIRFCEDNELVKPVWITGPDKRRQEALDAQLAYFRENPEHTDREWLEDAIRYLRQMPATKALVDTHSALEYAAPSGNAITELLKFWRDRSDEGKLLRDLGDESLSTRFLGDLYQDLSQYAKDKYALLQTPVFVEEHILDRTLDPALKERPLEGFRMIDPTCGSGHFLLGAFDRLLDRWHKHAPALEIQARVQSALDAIHGVDLNPFAVAIARFRLTVAALGACELRSLEDAPAFKYHLAVGDSLIHGPDSDVLPGMEERGAYMDFHYATEDRALLLEILEGGRYDAVVGNPPYITVKDKALKKIYRSKFGKVCKGQYALTVPFMVQFFALARRGTQSGWVGQITSNSFTKREFGVPLIEDFLARRDLRLVEDTSGAFIPDHGTPTVIIVGRNQAPEGSRIRAVLGVRGEPGQPDNPAEGYVWTSVVGHVDDAGWNDDWITVSDLDRKLFITHPWTLRGGGAIELLSQIENTPSRLNSRITLIGRTCHTGEDDAYFAAPGTWKRFAVSRDSVVALVAGDVVRDWSLEPTTEALFPYGESLAASLGDPAVSNLLWRNRTGLRGRREPGGTHEEIGLTWYEYSRWHPERYEVPLGIALGEVATHNHFVLDRGGKVFKQTAPAIKLPEGSTEDDHLNLLGVLNSSTACFWLKQKSYAKTGADNNSGGGNRWSAEAWDIFYQFNGSNVQECPLPKVSPLEWARTLDSLAQELAAREPSAVCATGTPSREVLTGARKESEEIQARMIAVQDELDWQVYRLYGLIDEELTYSGDDLPRLALGERAFEIALARSGEETAWFERHGSTAITEIPASWPAGYRDLVNRRIEVIAEHPFIKLLEKPEYKRRWSLEAWDKRQEKALRGWLLDRLEDRRFWFDGSGGATPRSAGQLADEVTRYADMVSVLALWEGRPDVPVTDSLVRLLAEEAVPFLAAYRYKDSGLRKREAWEETWDLQRREDAGEQVGDIQPPPRYTSADFRKPSYWRARGKLDVPKERFILYPDAGREGDSTPLLGWAGWDHAEQTLALGRIIGEREREGWADDRLVPLVAGLAELQPWVKQWHSEVHPVYGVSLGAFCEEQLAQRAAQVGKTLEELAAWRPQQAVRGRRSRRAAQLGQLQ